ncbi:hypothetical protein ID80_004721 [Salmonella enterica subsp. enterica serovar Ball]|nr:hypothetical protein [Salmonella enterica subsp. enterica serovar Minnesota]EDV5024061.1 hypothetical protein [Salmonella enterica subsp. enterica serovar Ball]
MAELVDRLVPILLAGYLSSSQVISLVHYRSPPRKRKISYAKPVFCTDCYPLSVTCGIYPVPA